MNATILAGALLGALSVVLGAYGAHGLNETFNQFPQKQISYNHAVNYQLIHSLILLILGFSSYIPHFKIPSYLWKMVCCSIIFFCFTIYIWVLGGPRWMLKVTPLGGLGFIFCWLCFIRLAWLNRLRG